MVLIAGCSEAEPEIAPADQVRAALESNDGFGAELVLRQMLENGSSKPEVAAFMGEAELLQGQPVEARKWLGEGKFGEGTQGRGFFNLGRLEMGEGNLPAAGTAFDNALRYIPDDPALWVEIGRLRYRGGEQTLALDAAVRAVELGPDDAEALMFRGQLVRDSEGMVAALPWFEKAIAVEPNDLTLLAEYAATLGEAGEAQDMLVAVRRITELNPGYLRAYYLQAVVAARAGKYDLARKLLVRSGEAVKDTPAGSLLSGVIDLETGNYASASQIFDKLYRRQPENRRVRELLARALAMSGSHRELVSRLGEVAKLRSSSPYMRTVVARSHEAIGQREEAAALLDLAARQRAGNLVAIRPPGSFERLAVRDETSGEDALALVRSNIVSGARGAAIASAEKFRSRFPGSADALSLAGDAQLARGRASQANKFYDQAAAIRQSWLLARRRMAALRAVGRGDEAQALLERYLIGHQTSVEPAALLARRHYDRGNLPRAALLLDHAFLAGGDRDPELLALRAVIAMRMDEPELAARIAKRAVDIQPMHPAALQAFAMVEGGALSDVLLAKTDRLGGDRQLARR